MKNKDQILKIAENQFLLDWYGDHGIQHFNNVWNFGQRLCKSCNADIEVVEVFSFLHDIGRKNEYYDPDHGKIAVKFIDSIRNLLDLTDSQFEKLCFAIENHNNGEISKDTTIQTCWDADRLDLKRVGIIPNQKYLSKNAQKLIKLENNRK